MSARSKIYLLCFLIALLIRLLSISLSRSKDHDIDLAIYRDAGQLVVNGINPYNFNDNVELRQKLRTDKDNFNEYVSSEQERWDYYANSNLPLATLFFGGVEYCFASPRAFRYVFAFFDSILAVMILAFVINKWKYNLPDNKFVKSLPEKFRTDLPIYLGFSLGAVSPILLLWGTFIPEPKGIGLLLILSSIYFSDSTNRKLSMLLSPVLLGFSVAFIGLGVFIAPLCLSNISKNNKNAFRNITIYCLISLISCAICLIPFMPELGIMMFNRMNGAINAEPYHGSMWTELFKLFPKSWLLFRAALIALFIGINIFGFLRKRLSILIISANLLYLFTCIYLLDGSLDRMNISIITLILLAGSSQVFYITNILWLFYFIYGIFSFFYSCFFGINQDLDGLFVFLFTILYIILVFVQSFTKKATTYEALNSNTRVQ
jgi:hypothetical protein